MLGPRHQPTYIEAVTFENEIDRHHRRLVEIQNGIAKKKAIEKESKLPDGREKVLKFHNSEKALEIERTNELLLGRLVEISRKRKNHLFPLSEPNNLPKSLNANHRKKEKDRIAAENEAFARRLLSQQPSFNRRKLDDDYERHADRVRLMQKRSAASTAKIKLPPINYAKYEELDVQRKAQSGKEKKSLKELSNKKKRRKSQKIGGMNEDEREDQAEAEEQKEKEEADKLLKEAKERREQEETEQKAKELKEKEEAELKAKEAEELEKAEKLRKEEEERRLEEEKNKSQVVGEGSQQNP